jgi:hypothetical protein
MNQNPEFFHWSILQLRNGDQVGLKLCNFRPAVSGQLKPNARLITVRLCEDLEGGDLSSAYTTLTIDEALALIDQLEIIVDQAKTETAREQCKIDMVHPPRKSVFASEEVVWTCAGCDRKLRNPENCTWEEWYSETACGQCEDTKRQGVEQ